MAGWNASPAPYQPAGGAAGACKRLPLALISACCGTSLVWHKDWAASLITSSLGITASLVERGTAWTVVAVTSLVLTLLSAWCVQDISTISSSIFSGKGAHHELGPNH